MRDLLVAAVDRQRVLDQVVGTDREELQPAQEHADGQRRRRNLDHAADADVLVVGDALVAQAQLGLLDRGQRLVDLVRVREHRHQQLDLAVVRGAQDGAQLRLEHRRFGQRQADRAQAERRVGLDAVGEHLVEVRPLVVAEVEGADGHRPPLHAAHDLAVGLELLVLAGHVAAAEEEELGAEQADALGPRLQRCRNVARHLDVGEQFDVDAVERARARILQALQLAALDLDLALAQLVLFEHVLVGVDDDDAARAVDDQLFLVADQLAGVVQAEHRRDAQAARENRRVRGEAADVGDEGTETVLLEGHHVSRRQVVRDDDLVLLALSARLQRGATVVTGELLDHALDRLPDVVGAFAQVEVVDLVELADQMFHLLQQRPLGVAALFADQHLRRLGEFGVGQDHRMQVDEGTELARCPAHSLLQRLVLAAHGRHRRLEAGDFLLQLPWGQLAMRDFERCLRQQAGFADGDAARDAEPVQGVADGEAHHSCSPKRSLISCTSAASAASSSTPVVSTTTVEPRPAASIITPMMLLALMRRLPFSIHTSQPKVPASWVSLAEARACSPSLLMISTSARAIASSLPRYPRLSLPPCRARRPDRR